MLFAGIDFTIYMDLTYQLGLHHGLLWAGHEGIGKVIDRRLEIEKTKAKMEIAIELIKKEHDLQFVSDLTQLSIEQIQVIRNVLVNSNY